MGGPNGSLEAVGFGFQTRSNSFRSVMKRGEVNSLRRLQAWRSPAVPKPIVPRRSAH
jgi:hypothetical protein